MKDPNLRPSAKDLLKHKWIKDAGKTKLLVDLVTKYLQAKNKKEPEPAQEEDLRKSRCASCVD